MVFDPIYSLFIGVLSVGTLRRCCPLTPRHRVRVPFHSQMQPRHPSQLAPIARPQQIFGYVSFAGILAAIGTVVPTPTPIMKAQHIFMPLNWRPNVFGTMQAMGMSTD